MTYQEREVIFSKDVITYKELALLLQVDETTGSTILQQIKRKSDRLGLRGKIHIQDYFDFFGITNHERYYMAKSSDISPN